MKKTGRVNVFDAEVVIVKSDVAVSTELQTELCAAVRVLEDVPDVKKDWHPHSDETVLDLVHPSLYPVVWGVTRALEAGTVPLDGCAAMTGKGVTLPPYDEKGAPMFYGHWTHTEAPDLHKWGSYQWLPAEVEISDEGGAKITSYVNNLHPVRHKDLYGILEHIVAATVPLWKDVLNGFGRAVRVPLESTGSWDYRFPKNLRYRIPGRQGKSAFWDPVSERYFATQGDGNAPEPDGDQAEPGDSQMEDSQMEDQGEPEDSQMEDMGEAEDGGSQDRDGSDKAEDGADADEVDEDEDEDWDDDWKWNADYQDWVVNHRILQFYDPPAYQPAAQRRQGQRGRSEPIDRTWQGLELRNGFPAHLQVIFKLANIHLTPDNPVYEGGSWHVEGTLTERICASAIYYYDQDNITDSHLAFQQSLSTEEICMIPEQSEFSSLEAYLGIANEEDAALQQLGQVLTREGRLLAFPNSLQHQVQPFELQDESRPGHRKILAMFLVDPHRPVLSSATVPSQRRDWWADEVRDACGLPMLPTELFDLTVDLIDDFPMSQEQADQIRLDLMEQRGMFTDTLNEAFEQVRWDCILHFRLLAY